MSIHNYRYDDLSDNTDMTIYSLNSVTTKYAKTGMLLQRASSITKYVKFIIKSTGITNWSSYYKVGLIIYINPSLSLVISLRLSFHKQISERKYGVLNKV